ncbi:acetylxylan esterase [Candidatus Sumerlaeota bacterium]|nr:acetylxylan esterase [Candidatus Sumerlaeota bacterium]
MTDRQFDSLQFSRGLYAQSRRSLSFQARNKSEAEAWQEKLRAKIIELLGGFPSEKCDLRPEITERRSIAEGVRETIVFQSRENLSVLAHLILPKEGRRPLPVIICLPGHGRGADDIVGINEDGSQRVWPPKEGEENGYQHDFALQAAANGYAALAVEMLGFGHRRDDHARKAGAGTSSCQPAAGAALLFDQTMAGWRTWDVMRSIDYLQTRAELDPRRIACMGISGGGTVTLYAAALDPRIQAAVMSCSFCTYADSIMSISHCMDNYVPGILNQAEMSDVAGLIAPRGFFAEAGLEDDIFPIAATRSAFAGLKKIYEILGAPEKIAMEEFDDEHRFWGKGAFSFLGHWL